MAEIDVQEPVTLSAPAAGRRLRVVLLGFYNYESHALRIFHPLLKQRGHDVHSIFFKNYFTFETPTPREEDMVVDLIARIRPDVVAMSVWSTYYQLAARISARVKAAGAPVVVWGGIHPQTRPEESLAHCDLAASGEGEYVLAELTDRIGLGLDWTDIRGTWTRRDGEVVRNPPRLLIPDLDVLPAPDLSSDGKYYLGKDAWRDMGVPKAVILRAIRSRAFLPNVQRIAGAMRRLQDASRWYMRAQDRRARRPNLLQQYAENTIRDFSPGSMSVVHPNFDNSPFSRPASTLQGAA